MIRLQSVSKTYEDGKIIALQDVSLSVEAGAMLALTGPSGSGKSTLLNLIGAMDTPTSGSIFIDDRELSVIRPKYRFRASTIGFVFQFHHLLGNLTACENVELPLYGTRIAAGERHRRAMRLLESVGLDDKSAKSPGQLSGGERQRVALARAMANNPRIILADEPTGSLDAVTGEAVIDLLIDYCATNQATMLLATHNPTVAAGMHGRLEMAYGRIT
ncbi:MAG: ABC transporter ATP-binding protein [Gammaproteobacteria bacterium]|nr:ABC transporter ATP-binding protein [Gammaproteobacteria bacterium]